MTCPQCVELRRQLEEAQAALAEWRRYDAAGFAEAVALERLTRWQARFRLTASQALILIALVDRGGMPMTIDALKAVTRQARAGVDHAREVQSNVVQTHVCRMRQELARDSLGRCVRVVRGVGYAVSAADALALKSRVGES